MSKKFRIEHDTMGDIEVAADRLWGAQTQRSLHHFHFPGETMPMDVVRAQVLVKKAAATTTIPMCLKSWPLAIIWVPTNTSTSPACTCPS